MIWLPARSLFHRRRLDLAVKARLFREMLAGEEGEALRLYRWHIARRTEGVEPESSIDGPSPKRSLDDYVRRARALLGSMRARGFDVRWPVHVGRDGVLVAGAHRTACAAVLGLDVAVVELERPGIGWDRRWFRSQGMTHGEVAALDRDLGTI